MAVGDEDTGPERTCIVTRRKASPDAMIRFVVGPDDTVVPDLRRKLPGRGVWVLTSCEVVREAVRKKAFARGFKAKVVAAETLASDIDRLMERDALQALAIANKAGEVTTGFAKVEATIGGGAIGALLHASDAADDGVRKLDAALRRAADGAKAGPPIKLFTSEQLDLALGRTNVIHAALGPGPAGHAFLSRCRRLAIYRSRSSDDMSADAKTAPA